MKKLVALVLAVVLLSPAMAFANSATDAALGLGAFAVFNQILGGIGIFGGVAPAPVYAPPAAIYSAPSPVYVAPAPVYVAPRPVYVAPRPVYVAPAPVLVAPPVVFGPPVVVRERAFVRHFPRHLPPPAVVHRPW
jgi:hypothetical protein